MNVKQDASGRRSIQLEYEVPGTPEQVWHAIATGPGISSWLFPTEVEEREGGAVAFHMGPGMESSGTVTAWEPPRRFAYEEPDWSPNAPPLGTEFIVEARSGGTCVVRLVHSLFTSSDEWDDQFDSFEAGWRAFFDVLRLYLNHFFGEPCSSVRAMGEAPLPEAETWNALAGALGLTGVSKGQRWSSAQAPGAPQLAGVIERLGDDKHAHEALLRLDEPAPGVALLGAHTWGGKTHASISLFLYGDRASAAAARDEPAWRTWLTELFAAVPAAS